MKKRRRIEITAFRRRTTIVFRDGLETDSAGAQPQPDMPQELLVKLLGSKELDPWRDWANQHILRAMKDSEEADKPLLIHPEESVE